MRASRGALSWCSFDVRWGTNKQVNITPIRTARFGTIFLKIGKVGVHREIIPNNGTQVIMLICREESAYEL